MDSVDTLVIGAGVIGLAAARRAAASGREVVVLEAADAIGTGTSSRNSEVIHAGIYYPEGSLKARHCVAGRQALYEYCESHGIPHKRVGKLIVATAEEEAPALDQVRAKAEANGVDDLTSLDAAQVRDMEPEVRCFGALLSPSTGIIDSHAYMLALLGDAEADGAVVAFASPLIKGRIEDGGITVEVGGAEAASVRCRHLINAAGLDAQKVAAAIEGFPAEMIPPLYYAKGNYFTLAGKSPFKRLIYPVPVPGGLGTHSTVDLAGQTKFGPDVEWVDAPDYTVDPGRASKFYEAIRRYWPGLKDGQLQPGYVGVRPKLAPQSATNADFVIQGPEAHGVAGIVNLFGIESPGLTSSLSIADAAVTSMAIAYIYDSA
ncbi:MAG: NAD(P)/FAD-dependent oxidoreductase [Rhodospirillales bacterium]|nr:NAD(P)/FAD-dependent oxidoreductase [Rhodospirillales bacterium]